MAAEVRTGTPLTAREIDVMHLVSDGLSNKCIADWLGISQHTVKFHITNACRRLGTTSRVSAAVKFVTSPTYTAPQWS